MARTGETRYRCTPCNPLHPCKHPTWTGTGTSVMSAGGMHIREARLRPEFAWRYPKLDRALWYAASSIVGLVGSRLPQEHFEFRGHGPERPPGARTRGTDRRLE